MLDPNASTAADNLLLQVGTATSARLVINTSRRFLYPFAAAFSRALGVPLPAVTSLIALNQFSGLLAPLFGPLSDRWGYRKMMVAALALLATGMFIAGVFPLYVLLAAGIFLGGLAKTMFDPALQAYIGERVTYQRRGLFIGLMEMSWAGAALVGIPLMGVLLARLGWQAPFLTLSGLALVGAVVLWLVIPADGKAGVNLARAISGRAWLALFRSRLAAGALLFGFFAAMANDVIFAVYGAWLERSFGLGLVALGSATTVIGLAELSGETLTATIADRLGLKRATLIGAALSALSYVLLPLLGQNLWLALAGLFITFITFEFTIVTSFSLFTEVLPQSRATMMATYLSAASLGRVIGAPLGGVLWLWGGISLAGGVAAVLAGLGVMVFVWGARTWQP